MVVLWMVIGALLGALVSGWSALAALTGAVLGLLWSRQVQLSAELKALRERLEARPVAPPPEPTQAPWMSAQAARHATGQPPAPTANQSTGAQNSTPARAAVASVRSGAAPKPATPPPPSLLDRSLQRVWSWFTEGNVPVKIGMLVLFAGVAALLKYAADAGMLRLPPGLRVSLIALAAMAGLAFGWRRRDVQRVFALSLQGGAIGVLLITVFAAFRLYGLLPAGAAFALLLVLVAGVGVLAVKQDALALAVLGLLAGFAAPILVSTGQGSHVVLFGYYALLNLAILGIAWKRSWRVLNLLGFMATFGVGTAWGVLRYEPALWASTEPFLVLNFLYYLVIPWLHVLRAPQDRRLVIDGCLMFGNPLISLLLQGALLRWDGTGLALSALAAAAIYLAIAFVARSHPAMRLLRDTWAVLAVAFATLAVPLALRADVTGSIFALEGAGLIWLGLRQQRPLARWSGLVLQLLAALALVFDRSVHGVEVAVPLLNREFISAIVLMLAGLASSHLYARSGSHAATHRALAVLFHAWGVLWWVVACVPEIHRFVPSVWRFAGWFGWLAVTASATAEAARRRPPDPLGVVLAYGPAAWMAAMLLVLIGAGLLDMQPLHGWNLAIVVVAAALGWRCLLCLRGFGLPAALAQLAWLWRWVLLGVVAIALALDPLRWLGESWQLLLASTPLLLTLALAQWRPGLLAPPLVEAMPRWLPPLRYSLLFVLSLLGVWALFLPGDATPVAYVPLLNPLELLLLLIAGGVARWLLDPALPPALRAWRAPVLGGVVLALATDFTLRAVHQLADVPWSEALAASSLAQMSLTVVWSVLGLFAWVWGSRRGHRLLWLAGAVLLGVVLAKLILVDRHHLGNLFGIGSFIAFGLLCSVIGYLAPAPPRNAAPTEESGHAP